MQAGVAEAIDWTYVSPVRKVGKPRSRLLGRIANALGLFFWAMDVSLEVESVSARRRSDIARNRLWSDEGGLGG